MLRGKAYFKMDQSGFLLTVPGATSHAHHCPAVWTSAFLFSFTQRVGAMHCLNNDYLLPGCHGDTWVQGHVGMVGDGSRVIKCTSLPAPRWEGERRARVAVVFVDRSTIIQLGMPCCVYTRICRTHRDSVYRPAARHTNRQDTFSTCQVTLKDFEVATMWKCH